MVYSGVIWKGNTLIDGVPETLAMLRDKVSAKLLCTFLVLSNCFCRSHKTYDCLGLQREHTQPQGFEGADLCLGAEKASGICDKQLHQVKEAVRGKIRSVRSSCLSGITD